MDERIAVFMKESGSAASCADASNVAVYERSANGWITISERYVNLGVERDMPGLRCEIRRLAESLAPCTIVAGTGISGIVYQELDRKGFDIFEIAETGPEVFNAILDAVEQSAQSCDEVPEKPIETEMPGVYFLDLLALQEKHPDISTKMAIKEFVEMTPFFELWLVCSHVPPWIEQAGFEAGPGQTPDGRDVMVIRRKQCKGGTL